MLVPCAPCSLIGTLISAHGKQRTLEMPLSPTGPHSSDAAAGSLPTARRRQYVTGLWVLTLGGQGGLGSASLLSKGKEEG